MSVNDVKPTSIMFYVFSIRDIKTDSFMTPFFQTHKPAAMRMFADLCVDKSSMIGKHPEDFSLYQVGAYDSQTGLLIPADKPDYLAQATDFIHNA